MKILFYILVTAFFVSCSHDNWSKKEQNKFVHDCREEGGSKSYCECFMQNVMEEYHIAEDADNLDFETKIELSKDCNE